MSLTMSLLLRRLTVSHCLLLPLLSLPPSLCLSLPHHLQIQFITLVTCWCICESLFLFPNLLHAKRTRGREGLVKAIAHRGSRLEGLPENTVAAFKDAVTTGACAVELDVWLSADGLVVVQHDETVTRMCGEGKKSKVVDLKAKDLPPIVPPNEEQKFRCRDFPAEEWNRIPLLEDVLKVVPLSTTLIIEFKQDSDELIKSVLGLLQKHGRGDPTTRNLYWFSLSEPVNRKLRKADPSIPTICSVTTMLKTIFLYYMYLLPFINVDFDVFGITVEEITLQKVRNEKSLKRVPDVFKRLLHFILMGKPSYIMVAPSLFEHMRARGIPVWFLGVNDKESLDIAVKSGATAVLTDRIKWLKNTIEKENLKFSEIK